MDKGKKKKVGVLALILDGAAKKGEGNSAYDGKKKAEKGAVKESSDSKPLGWAKLADDKNKHEKGKKAPISKRSRKHY